MTQRRLETLDDWRGAIEKEVSYVGIKPYSHNIITIALNAIAKKFGPTEANKAIDDFQLKELGWHKQEIQ